MGFVFLVCCSSVHREHGAIPVAPVPRTTADHRQRAIPESVSVALWASTEKRGNLSRAG